MEVWDSYAVFPSSGELGEWGVESHPLAGGEKNLNSAVKAAGTYSATFKEN